MGQFRSALLPSEIKSTISLVNWDLELAKSLLVEKVQKLQRFCLRELNIFIDNIIEIPLLGKFEDFIQQVDKAKNFRVLEQLVLRLIDFVDDTFENLIARGEQLVPNFQQSLPHFLNLPTLRRMVNTCFVEEILPLFLSGYLSTPVMQSRR